MSEVEQNSIDQIDPESPENLAKLEELHQIYHKHMFKHYDEIVALSRELEKKYDDDTRNSCRLNHLLRGSSPTPEVKIESFDFPEHEIENFFRNIEQSHTK